MLNFGNFYILLLFTFKYYKFFNGPIYIFIILLLLTFSSYNDVKLLTNAIYYNKLCDKLSFNIFVDFANIAGDIFLILLWSA